MRKILIPTDLRPQSMKLAEKAFEIYPDKILDLMFMYPYNLPVWSSDLYWYSPGKVIAELADQEFYDARSRLVDGYYKNINSIKIEVFTGLNSSAFNSFRNQHQIQTAVIPKKGLLDFSSRSTFNPIALIEKNVPNVHMVRIEEEETPERDFEKDENSVFSIIKRTFSLK
ncbi:MAG: hypothetical protein WBG48_16725 [Pricia sp.]